MLTLSIWSAILGVVVTLFFQCMGALLNPVDRTRGTPTKWGLVAHTVIMFSLTTVYTGMGLDIQSVCYINNREFHLENWPFPPGPDGYWILLYQSALAVVPNTLFLVNSWLADGILVSPFLNISIHLPDIGHSPSSIVALLSMPGTTGSLPSHV